MGRTTNLRRQHDAAVALVEEIAGRLGGPPPSETEAYGLGMQLAKLSGLLRIHFAQEDKALYPYMAASEHPDAVATAAAFQDEMGGLGAVYADFAGKWSSGRVIAGNFDGFRNDARAVFAALADRIERENTILYPLAEAIGPDQIRLTA